MDNYLAVWKVLEELTTALRMKGVGIPETTMTRLRSSRATISIYEVDPTYGETVELIEGYLVGLEAELVSLAEEELGEDFAKEFPRKIFEARQKKPKEPEVTKGFIPGVPRSDYWIRIRIGDTISGEELQDIAAQQGLSTRDEGTGSIVIHGEKKKVKELVREIAKKMRKRKD